MNENSVKQIIASFFFIYVFCFHMRVCVRVCDAFHFPVKNKKYVK